ncbi:hypothetical protein E4656_02120 [Natronospirillum operosum]|uniref:Sulfotransferase family protein n=1 Tax=Natronospirillum operosum TaxID=2759953 RepID=A0A4Z0W9D9_9GAMM|nr:sulfotransferase family 2 domain-containing protein [Natronospirillum operosum]TGG95239.1 hypothetical protein E4656_02120 [Natronospirillum operosum]
MLSHRHRCIFIHIRKSAGTSIKHLFADASKDFDDGVLDPHWPPTQPPVSDYYRFTVVRNPWDRFVSGWKYLTSTRRLSLHDVLRNLPQQRPLYNVLAPQAPLNVRWSYARIGSRRRFQHTRYRLLAPIPGLNPRRPKADGHDYRHLTLPLCDQLLDAQGQWVVHKVVPLEDLANGLSEVSARTGIDISHIPHANRKRKGDDYRQYFDEEAQQLFARHFADDIERLGYRFDLGPGVPPVTTP